MDFEWDDAKAESNGRNPITREVQAVPRHREINEHLARKIIRTLRNPDEGAAPEGDDA